MASKRALALMAALAGLMVYYFYPVFQDYHRLMFPQQYRPTVLPGANAMSKPKLVREADGKWKVVVEYFYTGAPQGAVILSEHVADYGTRKIRMALATTSLVQGTQTFSVPIHRTEEQAVTAEISLKMGTGNAELLATSLMGPIDWTTGQSLADGPPAKGSDMFVTQARLLIDQGREESLKSAKAILERTIEKDPQSGAAHVQLARIAMRGDAGVEGARQAENLLKTALKIRADDADAMIHLARLYTAQERYKEAEPLLADAATTAAANPWLWTVWGELLRQQGKVEPAMEKFRQALAIRPGASPDRARRAAYGSLLQMLEWRKDLDAASAVHRQRVADYGMDGCFALEHARFEVEVRGDVAQGRSVMTPTVTAKCEPDEGRQILALMNWIEGARASGAEQADLFNKARAILPVGPELFYRLARSDRNANLIKALLNGTDTLAMQDNGRYDALAYALRSRDVEAARRLLRLGSKPDAVIGLEQMPVALLPVMLRDFDGIRLMQRSGIDYAKLRFQGSTVLELVRQSGDARLLRALDPKAGSV